MQSTRNRIRRKFLGKLNGFENILDKRVEQKHLKEYLKGNQFFTYSKDLKGKPMVFKVQQEYYEIEPS